MTHTPEIGAKFWRRFFVLDRIWYEKLVLKINRIEYATDRRQNLVPEKSVWHTVQKSAPIFSAPKIGAKIWTVCHWLKSTDFKSKSGPISIFTVQIMQMQIKETSTYLHTNIALLFITDNVKQ